MIDPKLAGLSISVQERDFDLLHGLFECRTMTSAHISALYFEGRGEAAKKRLQKLKVAGFIGERRRTVVEPAALFLTRKAILLLREEGVLNAYPRLPRLDSCSLSKRSSVSDQTVQHELAVMDVKAAFHSALKSSNRLKLDEFTTWPLLCQFAACDSGKKGLVLPDDFLCISEWECGKRIADYSFFFELDRSAETLDRLVSKGNYYLDFCRSGGFALRNGGDRSEYKDFPFRVLMVFKNAERRNNIAERLLQNRPPILRQLYLSTSDEAKTNLLGPIWIRPVDYREVAKGTPYEPRDKIQKWGYKRQSAREFLVEERIQKCPLLEAETEPYTPILQEKQEI